MLLLLLLLPLPQLLCRSTLCGGSITRTLRTRRGGLQARLGDWGGSGGGARQAREADVEIDEFREGLRVVSGPWECVVRGGWLLAQCGRETSRGL